MAYASVAQWTRARGYEPRFVGGSNPSRCTTQEERISVIRREIAHLSVTGYGVLRYDGENLRGVSPESKRITA